MKNYLLILLISISILLSFSYCILDASESSISITTEMQYSEITIQEKQHLFSASFDKTQGKFIYLLLVPKDYDNEYNHIFVSIPGEDDKIPTYKESDYKTVDKNTTLLIETSKISSNVNAAKIAIECKESCDFSFYYQIVTTIPFISDRSFDLILNSNEEFVLEYEPDSTLDLNNKFTFFSNAPSDFTLKIIYNDTENILPLTEFYNGYGLFIDNETYPEGGKFTFKLSHYGKPNELVHVSNRKLTKEIKNLAIGDFHNSIVGIPDLEKECFKLPKISGEENDKNYNLNFLTYTKNILVTFDNLDTFEIKSVSDIIQIDAKKYSEMCFSSTDGNIATTTFQILDGTEQTLTQDMQMPLYRGVPKKGKLLKGQLAYYRLYFYPLYSKNLIMNLKSIEGKAKLYYGVCNNYPNCNFQESQLSQFETEKDINNNAFIKKEINEDMTKPYSDPEFQVAIVYCTNDENEKDCEYYITLSNDYDEINIIENEKYYSSIQGYQLDEYQFDINDPQNELEYLIIHLYSYTGQGDIAIYSDKEMTKEIQSAVITAVQNQVTAIITASSLEANTLHGKYYIKIKGITNTVYSIYYYTSKKDAELTNNYLTSNEVNIQAIKCNNEEESYLIKNNARDKKIPFLFEYNSLNCDLEVSLTGESGTINERNYQYIIDSTKSYYNNEYYEMKIKVKNADIEGSSTDSLCLVALTGAEIEENKEIILNDGVIQKGKLTNSINYINYLYTFMVNSASDDVTLFFKKDSNYITDLSYAFGNSDLKTYKVVNTEKSLVFTKDDFIEKCPHYSVFCSLKIQIKINEKESLTENSYIDFMLSVNNKITYPSYLPKDKMIKNVLQTNQYQYYYLDLGKNEECDIFLDFNEGLGQAVAKIVKKDEIEENANYNRRVILPIPGMTENYVFDQYTKQLKITKDMTSKCENGCEVYIAVFHIDQRFTDYISSFNIYYRKNNNIVYVPENTFVYGNLKSLEDKNFYRTTINKKTGIIIFNIIGEHTLVYINKGKTIPSKENKNYMINSDLEKELIIKSDSFEGQIFTYTVETSKLDNNNYRNYEIKIDTPDSDDVNIKQIDYLHNNPCYYTKDNTKCHYVLPVEKYNKESKLYLFTPDNKNTLIYANYISMEEFDSLTTDEKRQKLPTELIDNSIIDISGRTQEIYVLITVESKDTESSSFANLVVGGYYHASTSFLRPNTFSFYSITKDNIRDNLNLAIESQDLYQLKFVYLSGKDGIISQSEVQKEFVLNNNQFNSNLVFLFESELKKQRLFSIKFNQNNNDLNADDEICFYTYIEQKSSTSNIVHIKYNDNIEEKYEFIKNEKYKSFFPLSFYELMPGNINEDKQFIFQIYNFEPVTHSNDDFTDKKLVIEGYILNETCIEDIIINPDNLEKEKVIVTGEYNNEYLIARIRFTKEIIQKYAIYDKNYFYLNIKCLDDESIQFEHFEIDLFKSTFNFNEITKYNSFPIKAKENKNLLLIPKFGISKMLIEFFLEGKSDIKDYTISIRQYIDDNFDYSQNEYSIIEYSKMDFEKQLIMVYIQNNMHYIVADIIKNQYNENDEGYYILKYRVASSDPTNYYLDKDRSISYSLNETNLEMNFFGVRECEQSCTFHNNFEVNYIIKFYDQEKIKKEPKDIKNIILNEEPLYYYNITKKGEDETKQKVDWKVTIEKNDKKAQLVQIVGYASLEDNEEIFVYNSFSVKYEEKGEDKKEEKEHEDRTTEFWIILFCFVGIIIITFGSMYVYIYSKIEIGRRTLMMNNAAQNISLIQRPSDRITGNTNTRMTI